MDKLHSFWMIVIIALVTAATRFLPFLIFRKNQTMPAWLSRLGKVLPHAIMGMLVVYCLKGISFTAMPFGIPELLGCGVVAALHVWKRNTLLSIGGGTLVYMLLVQLVF
jgi:branched-subunit amino acid transport protein AzlD